MPPTPKKNRRAAAPIDPLHYINPRLRTLAVPVDTLRPTPKNTRAHDDRSVSTIAKSFKKFGQQKPIVALVDGTVIAGNGSLAAAKSLNWSHLAVVTFEDEKQWKAFAVADNRTAELSTWDDAALLEVLEELRTDVQTLDAMGFSDLEVERIAMKGPTDADAEWAGMPDFDQQDKTAQRQLIVNFKNAKDYAAFGKLIKQKLSDKTRSIWYPEAPIEGYADKQYVGKK
jgi:ParB-like chromosome segregation protein Spo0J